ncbi:MAG TPA: choice-of-anchor J domain-containing protein, partial [Rariglobus sp.]
MQEARRDCGNRLVFATRPDDSGIFPSYHMSSSIVGLFARASLRFAGIACFFVSSAGAQILSENFDDISTLATNGWHLQNASSPVGLTNWFQGTNVGAGGPFDSHTGAANSYIGANY